MSTLSEGSEQQFRCWTSGLQRLGWGMIQRRDRLAAFAGLFLLGFAPLAAQATAEGWITDLAAAKKQAAETKRDIFMNSTGSDW